MAEVAFTPGRSERREDLARLRAELGERMNEEGGDVERAVGRVLSTADGKILLAWLENQALAGFAPGKMTGRVTNGEAVWMGEGVRALLDKLYRIDNLGRNAPKPKAAKRKKGRSDG